jgi:hypothetical protein
MLELFQALDKHGHLKKSVWQVDSHVVKFVSGSTQSFVLSAQIICLSLHSFQDGRMQNFD